MTISAEPDLVASTRSSSGSDKSNSLPRTDPNTQLPTICASPSSPLIPKSMIHGEKSPPSRSKSLHQENISSIHPTANTIATDHISLSYGPSVIKKSENLLISKSLAYDEESLPENFNNSTIMDKSDKQNLVRLTQNTARMPSDSSRLTQNSVKISQNSNRILKDSSRIPQSPIRIPQEVCRGIQEPVRLSKDPTKKKMVSNDNISNSNTGSVANILPIDCKSNNECSSSAKTAATAFHSVASNSSYVSNSNNISQIHADASNSVSSAPIAPPRRRRKAKLGSSIDDVRFFIFVFIIISIFS